MVFILVVIHDLDVTVFAVVVVVDLYNSVDMQTCFFHSMPNCERFIYSELYGSSFLRWARV